jgi:hypothetical protein
MDFAAGRRFALEMPRGGAAWSAGPGAATRMHALMLILSFAAVFALFCSACSLLVFAVVKFVRAVRAFRNRPRYVGIVERYEAPHLQENFKRAGQ